MIILLAGDTFGRITELYERVEEVERNIGTRCDVLVHTGNFGIWPDPNRLDRATRKDRQAPEFPSYYLQSRPVPRLTFFVPGKHEDHRWMDFMLRRKQTELLPNLHWLLSGVRTTFTLGDITLSMLGFGKVYSPKSYHGARGWGHYTKAEMKDACAQGPVDLLITHEAGKDACLDGKTSLAEGINKICFATRPKLQAHGHFNCTHTYLNPHTNTPTLSLAFHEIAALTYDGDKFQTLLRMMY